MFRLSISPSPCPPSPTTQLICYREGGRGRWEREGYLATLTNGPYSSHSSPIGNSLSTLAAYLFHFPLKTCRVLLLLLPILLLRFSYVFFGLYLLAVVLLYQLSPSLSLIIFYFSTLTLDICRCRRERFLSPSLSHSLSLSEFAVLFLTCLLSWEISTCKLVY